ncbi:MAG: T9SS type A sorting domain-containing protein, partial [Prevotellaceae bacterium]|nr:T9SS type A sorting domain-containing protein [Prevotellaceae bacterium]
ILSNEANLVYITADKRQLTVTGNVIEYAADCNQQSFALELSGSPYSTVWVAGQLYEPGQIIETDGDKTKVDIRVVSETGNATKDYTLIVYKAITADLYYMRWENVLSINANPNIGYNIEAVRWFKSDGSHVGNKGYIQIEQLKDPMSHYYAEIKTQEKEGWRHVCGIPKTRSIEKITAYPNPVLYGEDVTLKLPEHYIGATLNIYDIKGSLVKSGISLPEKSNSINVSELNLSSGMYLFNIVKDNNREAVKIIIE